MLKYEPTTLEQLLVLGEKAIDGTLTTEEQNRITAQAITMTMFAESLQAELDKAEKDIAEWKRMYNQALSLPFSGDFDD